VLVKMANLDGSRRNGAKHEIDLTARLLSDPERLVALYQMILAAARDSGSATRVRPVIGRALASMLRYPHIRKYQAVHFVSLLSVHAPHTLRPRCRRFQISCRRVSRPRASVIFKHPDKNRHFYSGKTVVEVNHHSGHVLIW
jgi:hypothetical protein